MYLSHNKSGNLNIYMTPDEYEKMGAPVRISVFLDGYRLQIRTDAAGYKVLKAKKFWRVFIQQKVTLPWLFGKTDFDALIDKDVVTVDLASAEGAPTRTRKLKPKSDAIPDVDDRHFLVYVAANLANNTVAKRLLSIAKATTPGVWSKESWSLRAAIETVEREDRLAAALKVINEAEGIKLSINTNTGKVQVATSDTLR